MHQEAVYAHVLNCLNDFSPRRLAKLHDYFGSYETAWRASPNELAAVLREDREFEPVPEKKYHNLRPEEEQKRLDELHITPLLKEDPFYPEQLHHLPSPPTLLYLQGTMPTNTKPAVAVVGTRMATPYGREACRTLVGPLARAGIPIISGLAAGIDTEAHRTALAASGYTAAVLGSGIARTVLYPASNKRLADEIVSSGGALISEYPPYMKAAAWTFPLRNRIIAGLSSAVLVIEARQKSGTLITARHALELGRDVLAVPGSIFSATSETPNSLIRDGATPVTSPEDIFEALGMQELSQKTSTAPDDVSKEEQSVLEVLAEPQSANGIARALQKHIGDIQHTLALLEIHGMVRNMGNGVYRKV